MNQTRSVESVGGLFDHFVCRLAGLPAECFDPLRAAGTIEALDRLSELNRKAESAADEISDALFAEIGKTSKGKLRGLLVSLKRDIHNRRLPSESALERVREFQPRLAKRAAEFRSLAQERQAELERIRQLLRGELSQIRSRFQQLVGEEDLQRGLILSSPSLFKELSRYGRAAPGKLKKKERQAERSLMRYFSRMVMKATPFSTFCAVVPGRLDADGNREMLRGRPRRKTCLVRLNKSVYTEMLARLLAHPQVRKNFGIELNPTMRRQQDGRLVFLAARGSREIFQRMPVNPIVALLLKLFEGKPSQPLQAVIDGLSSDPRIDASPEQAEQFVSRLLEIGFFRFRIGIREQEIDWDLPLRELLDGMDIEAARTCSGLLKQLRSSGEAYVEASVPQRVKLLESSTDLTTDVFKELDDQLDEESKKGPVLFVRAEIKLRTQIPFYEDSGADAEVILPKPGFQELNDCLTEYVALTSRIADPRNAMAAMRCFFERFYGSERHSVPLLEFYEDYYREHFKEILERMQGTYSPAPAPAEKGKDGDEEGKPEAGSEPKAEAPREGAGEPEGEEPKEAPSPDQPKYDLSNPFNLEFVERVKEGQADLTRLIQKRWREDPGRDEIRIEREDLERILEGIPEADVECRSVSMFVQHLPGAGPGGRDALVANAYLAGFGKYFSRFLSLFPEDVQQEVLSENQKLSTQLLAEICGDAGFNANLHPPLLPWEISYPTGESGPTEAQLRSSEIAVERDSRSEHLLQLRHAPTGKRVLPVDLGFMNPRMRPPLYQLLSRFTPLLSFVVNIPSSPHDASAQAKKAAQEKEKDPSEDGPDEQAPQPAQAVPPVTPAILIRPRITYRGLMVLSRKAWTLRPEAFPKRNPADSEEEYFIQVDTWRRKHGIPAEVFMRVHPLAPKSAPTPAADQGGEKKERSVADEGGESSAEKGEESSRSEAKVEGGPGPDPAKGDGAKKEGAEEGEESAQRPAQGQGEPDSSAKRPAPKRIREHLYKPQYVDFRSPLLVDLFSKGPENLENFSVVLEERLPSHEHLLRTGGESYASEFILQVDFPEGRAEAQ